MWKKMLLLLLVISVSGIYPVAARNTAGGAVPANAKIKLQPYPTAKTAAASLPGALTAAQSDTTYLCSWTFDAGAFCDAQGWTSVDRTEQTGRYFHIDDFSSLGGGTYGRLNPLQGAQSLWCGARPSSVDPALCSYAALPGYGNQWDQSWVFKCIEVPLSEDLLIDYFVAWDSEAGYDFSTLEYLTDASSCDNINALESIPDDGWIQIASFDGIGAPQYRTDVIQDYAHEGYVKLRFRFESDAAWSDQDGQLDSDGAVIIDSLMVRSQLGTVYDSEDFEDEAVGDVQTVDGDWTCWTRPGYGDLAGLFPGTGVVQEWRPCDKNSSCLWAFISGSTDNYACGGFPAQAAVPKVNSVGQYINNEIVSPLIPWSGSGTGAELAFDLYIDLPLANVVFYTWKIRSWIGGCPGPWQNDNLLYYGDQKAWLKTTHDIGGLIETGAEYIQISLGVADMCEDYCGIYGPGSCHSHAPLFDNVTVYRYSTTGPAWSVRDIDLFQDTFPSEKSAWGPGRADMAMDINPYANPVIRPGDSVVVTCNDPVYGLGTDPTFGGPSVYCSIALQPQPQPIKSPTAIEGYDALNGGNRWPFVGTTSAGGLTWYNYRMDQCFTEPGRSGAVAGKYCIDFNDNVFTSGDTINFFFYADNSIGQRSYWSEFTGTVRGLDWVVSAPMEFQILPSFYCGFSNPGDVLYVDDYGRDDSRYYFETSFAMMNFSHMVDRYDVRGASSAVANSPGGRVENVVSQLIPHYRKIIWNCGDLCCATLGDGITNEKADDFWVIYDFLEWHTDYHGAGVYLSGDDIAEEWVTLAGLAVAFRVAFMPHGLTSGSHRSPVDYGANPTCLSAPGIFSFISPPHQFVAYGGYPVLNDFDVLNPTMNSRLEMAYSSDGETFGGGAVISHDTLSWQTFNPCRVVLSGFSYHYIRDDMPGDFDRADHLQAILWYFENIAEDPVGVPPELLRNSLSQNYPNPFNPVTTVRYSIKERGHVRLKVYNVAGQLVKTLVDAVQVPKAGGYALTWDGRNNSGEAVASGVYFYKLQANDFIRTKKMVLLK